MEVKTVLNVFPLFQFSKMMVGVQIHEKARELDRENIIG